MTLQCSITRKRGTATFTEAGNPLRQTLHTSNRDLIFNYPQGAQSSDPANQCVAGKPASSCRIRALIFQQLERPSFPSQKCAPAW